MVREVLACGACCRARNTARVGQETVAFQLAAPSGLFRVGPAGAAGIWLWRCKVKDKRKRKAQLRRPHRPVRYVSVGGKPPVSMRAACNAEMPGCTKGQRVYVMFKLRTNGEVEIGGQLWVPLGHDYDEAVRAVQARFGSETLSGSQSPQEVDALLENSEEIPVHVWDEE